MVSHDDGHAEHLRQPNLLVIGHAAVHGKEQLMCFCDLAHCVAVEAVALAVAAGDIVIHLCALFAEGFQHDGGCAHAVHVVIAVDHDRLVRRNGLTQQRHGLIHVLHHQRRIQLLQRRMQKPLRLLHGIHAPRSQQPRQPKRILPNCPMILYSPPYQMQQAPRPFPNPASIP